jgi:hypothetical protein
MAMREPPATTFSATSTLPRWDQLDDWVPVLHPTSSKQATGAWRITSKNLGRDLEEDLSYHPDGISDYGEEHGLTPIDAVQRYGGATDAVTAAM